LSARDLTDDSHAVPPCRLTAHRVASTRLTAHRVASTLQSPAMGLPSALVRADRGGARKLKFL
jgi:hypothetical protein